MHAITVAIDLAKDVFELAFADERGQVVERKRLSRRTFARALEQRPPLRVLMEACGSAHYWARRFQGQGHAVRLLPARDVRPYVRGNKTDRNDVAGILEADRCGDIAGVPVKTPEQQGIQALHRLREHLKAERTATINLLRGVLREFGLTIPAGALKVPAAVRDALEDGDNELPMSLRYSLDEQLQRLAQMQGNMAAIEQRLDEFATRDAAVQRYRRVPGVGLLTATALRASAGDLSRFRNGRQFAAWLGLTPREHSSGQQRRLGGMTKRGDVHLRTLLVHGARAVLQAARLKQRRGQALDPLQAWALKVQDTRGHNKAACALANKLARRLWAMEHHGRAFDPQHVSQRPIAR
ncbi:IS110 family transposase [Pseudoxanthomonas koreensis]|uniref:IS110 family transposase n=1 Tax=Pseudoxanthomonas koreensis TaxID=266061 RepID=UPI0013917EE6|nr:IS110 family transposase [Pseudoxanthomonas koreensis]KAF1688610.1 IS110 family transposase [Pseudoxanthomonas koreensis]